MLIKYICSTAEKKELSVIIQREKGTLEETLSKNSTCLLCASGGSKLLFALENNIPVVKLEWIQDSVAAKGSRQ
jgi:hypothetical protein